MEDFLWGGGIDEDVTKRKSDGFEGSNGDRIEWQWCGLRGSERCGGNELLLA